MFRKAKALGELGYFERSERLLEDIASKSPAGKDHICLSCLKHLLIPILQTRLPLRLSWYTSAPWKSSARRRPRTK